MKFLSPNAYSEIQALGQATEAELGDSNLHERILGEQDKLKSTSDEAVRYYNEHSIGMFEIPVDRQPTPMQKIMTATAQSSFWDEEWGNPEDDDSLDSSLESGSMPGSYA